MKFKPHLSNLNPQKFQTLSNEPYGQAQCLNCSCLFDYDIFTYENIICKNNKLILKCPNCGLEND